MLIIDFKSLYALIAFLWYFCVLNSNRLPNAMDPSNYATTLRSNELKMSFISSLAALAGSE